MDTLGELLRDPAWWISAVVVAFVMGIAANYGTRGLEASLTRLSAWGRSQNIRRQEKFEWTVGQLVNHQVLMLHAEMEIVRLSARLNATIISTMVLFGILLMSLVTILVSDGAKVDPDSLGFLFSVLLAAGIGTIMAVAYGLWTEWVLTEKRDVVNEAISRITKK